MEARSDDDLGWLAGNPVKCCLTQLGTLLSLALVEMSTSRRGRRESCKPLQPKCDAAHHNYCGSGVITASSTSGMVGMPLASPRCLSHCITCNTDESKTYSPTSNFYFGTIYSFMRWPPNIQADNSTGLTDARRGSVEEPMAMSRLSRIGSPPLSRDPCRVVSRL
jgi:hypothetical protein